ncbi:hypothetical protein D3C81_2180420 [compost metagenome]
MPRPPVSTLAAPLPVSLLPRLLPTPLIAAVPDRVRFSWKLPKVRLTVAITVSTPPAALASMTWSAALST